MDNSRDRTCMLNFMLCYFAAFSTHMEMRPCMHLHKELPDSDKHFQVHS